MTEENVPTTLTEFADSRSIPRKGRKPKEPAKPVKHNPGVAIRELKRKVGSFLPEEDREYLFGVLEGEQTPELRRDIDIFLAMQLKALLPILSEEIQTATLTREGTQRSSTVKELLALRFQMEKHEKGDDATGNQLTFIYNQFGERGMDPGRIAALLSGPEQSVQSVPRVVSGDVHDDEGDSDEVGAVPDQLPERPVEVQGYRKE